MNIDEANFWKNMIGEATPPPRMENSTQNAEPDDGDPIQELLGSFVKDASERLAKAERRGMFIKYSCIAFALAALTMEALILWRVW